MADDANQCSICGAELSATAERGVCARCQTAQGMTVDTPPPTDGHDTVDTPPPTDRDDTMEGPTAPRALARGTAVGYFGDYEILKVLGRGGMGVVYEARQVSLNRLVALKMMKAGMLADEDDLRRFQNEAEAVALLDHAGIVPVYEVGEHDGQRYFSMKRIEGENLAHQLASFKDNPRAAATLLAETAEAIHHAHVRGILHRDLKPANILIDAEGHPHVTDFGLAKRVEGDIEMTQSGAILGTPAYMSPEQAQGRRGSITTATDIYGLGAILYSLLAGRAPFGGDSLIDTLDAVKTRPPASPRKFNNHVPTDLETICLKCLEKEPARRYHSAADLAADLECWLEGRPITARHVGGMTRAVMWCKRKPLVAGLAAALLIAVFVGTAGILINWLEVRRANVQIRSEWEASRQLNEFLVADMLGQSSPFSGTRPDVPVSALLDRSAATAGSRFANRPKIEGSIRQVLGYAYLSLGMLSKAETELLRSSRLRQSLPAGDELDRLSTEYLLARLRIDQGRYDEAEAHVTRAYEGRRRLLGDSDEATLEAAQVLAAVLKLKGKVDDSTKLLEKTAALAQKALGDEHRVTLRALTNLAIIAHDQGRFQEAAASFDQITNTYIRVFGADDPETLIVRSKLAATLVGLGEDARAETLLAECIGPATDILGPDHPETLRIRGNLAAVRSKLKKFDEATKGLDETLKGQQNVLSANHAETFRTEMNRAVILLQQDKLAEGQQILGDLIIRMRKHLKGDDPMLGNALSARAAALYFLDRTAEAEPLNAEAIKIFRKTLPPDHPQVVSAEGTQATLLLANGKPTEAETLAIRVAEIRSRPGWVGDPSWLGSVKSVLGGALAAQKKFAEAEPLLLEGFRIIEADPKADKRRRDDAIKRLVQLYESLGKPEEATRWRTLRTSRPGS